MSLSRAQHIFMPANINSIVLLFWSGYGDDEDDNNDSGNNLLFPHWVISSLTGKICMKSPFISFFCSLWLCKLGQSILSTNIIFVSDVSLLQELGLDDPSLLVGAPGVFNYEGLM